MKRPSTIHRALLGAATALVIAGIAIGCGDDDGTDSTAPVQPAVQSQSPEDGATGPASAGDERPTAPDDKISERPGGPKDQEP